MNNKLKAQLKQAGNLIASEKLHVICDCIGDEWSRTREAQMIKSDKTVNATEVWWGKKTTGAFYDTPKARGARLIGIAMMVTMPKEIKDGKCHK
jgi:hypothetical protein